MSQFETGDRVRILNAAPPFPRGSTGIVASVHTRSCGVVLDVDPSGIPADFEFDELEEL